MERLRRLLIDQTAADFLFASYAAHRVSPRSHEEMAWLLIGERQGEAAIIHAAWPASEDRAAGTTYVGIGPATATAAVEVCGATGWKILGLVHTHPGDMHRPSDKDLAGDKRWVFRLPHGDGVFGIGIVAAAEGGNVLTQDNMAFHWWALSIGHAHYRKLAVGTGEA